MEKKAKKKKLTYKQEMFAQEFVKDFNSSGAARRAGYSKKNSSVIGSQVLASPCVQERIEEIQKKRLNKMGITQEKIISNLLLASEIALGNTKTHIVSNGQGGAVSDKLRKTDLTNYIKIQEMLAKHINFFEKDNTKKLVTEDLSTYTLEQLIERDKLTD